MNTAMIDASKKGYYVTKDGEVISPLGRTLSKNPVNRYGYHFFTFRLFGKRTVVMTHRLQAYQKFGNEMFREGIQVRHINGNPSDNSWDNIQIGTASENNMDKCSEIRKTTAGNASRKHDHVAILADRKKGMTYSEIGNKYGISKGTISFIVNKSILAE